MYSIRPLAATAIVEMTIIEDNVPEKKTVSEEIELGLSTGSEVTAALKEESLTDFSAIAVVGCIFFIPTFRLRCGTGWWKRKRKTLPRLKQSFR